MKIKNEIKFVMVSVVQNPTDSYCILKKGK